MQPLSWEAAASTLWLPRFRDRIEPYRGILQKLTPDDLPTVVSNVQDWAERMRAGLALFSPEAKRRHVVALFGTWFSVFLADRGFQFEALPGWPVRARRGDAIVEPFTETAALFEHQVDSRAWAERCETISSACMARA